jgi:hypothetical protein
MLPLRFVIWFSTRGSGEGTDGIPVECCGNRGCPLNPSPAAQAAISSVLGKVVPLFLRLVV